MSTISRELESSTLAQLIGAFVGPGRATEYATVFTWQLPAIDSASFRTASTYHSAWLCWKSPARRSPAAQIIRASVAAESAGLECVTLPLLSPSSAYFLQLSGLIPSGPRDARSRPLMPLPKLDSMRATAAIAQTPFWPRLKRPAALSNAFM